LQKITADDLARWMPLGVAGQGDFQRIRVRVRVGRYRVCRGNPHVVAWFTRQALADRGHTPILHMGVKPIGVG
jgi:hypothetical protein